MSLTQGREAHALRVASQTVEKTHSRIGARSGTTLRLPVIPPWYAAAVRIPATPLDLFNDRDGPLMAARATAPEHHGRVTLDRGLQGNRAFRTATRTGRRNTETDGICGHVYDGRDLAAHSSAGMDGPGDSGFRKVAMLGPGESGLLTAGDLLPDGSDFLGEFAQPGFNSVS